MIDLVGSAVEAASGYLVGRYNTKQNAAKHIAFILISLACGLLFFLGYGIQQLISPAPNPMGNIWLGLALFSVGISFVVYLLLLIDAFIKKKKKVNC